MMKQDNLNVSVFERLHRDDPRTLMLLLIYKKRLMARQLADAVVKAFRVQARITAEGLSKVAQAIRKAYLETEGEKHDLIKKPHTEAKSKY